MDQNVNPIPPYESPDMPPVGDAPKKSSKTWLIILIVAIVLCCCCVVVVAGGYLYNNGDALMEEWSALSPLVG
ncbi:MAG: hypothetical protein AB9891_14250 [Anaerolineaceae bacterium]